MATLAKLLLYLTVTGLLMPIAAAQPREVITLGAEDDAAPWSYADGSGYVNDLVRQAFSAMGWDVQLKVMPYARCKTLTLRGLLAGCFSASKLTEYKDKLVYPQHPVFQAQNVLLALADSPWKGCDSARWPSPPRVGTVRAYEYTPQLESLLASRNLIRHEVDSEISNLRKLEAKRIDAAVITLDQVKRLEFLQALAHTSEPLKTVCDFGSQPAYVMFSKLHPQGPKAQTVFDAGMRRLDESGALARLQDTWHKRALAGTSAKPH
ncbi:substrate-binding periplasmic protein [Aquabacterium sp.]|uniref:substrate-binding periplasmic protein n=1 Tax=Aquabacterium sp. TaxID=1872578 RepID=UPI002E2FAA0A|nr:transporter substrate-binding domain-containing protein [Aquabacterium sp.]HEX5310834.1 transporter substrate-binding domain-containing protein [Aquabacterium sp.]